MNWLNRLLTKNEKPILYCIHGFGVRRTHEFDVLKDYFENLGYSVIIPEIFNQSYLDDIDSSQWIKRVEQPLIELITQNKRVWVVGFSMGGVIASYLAARLRVDRLVLLAPAFEYMTIKAILDTVEGVGRKLIKRPEILNTDYPPLPDIFTSTFKEVIALGKESIKDVTCPVLIFHGTDDATIPLRSSEYAYDSIKHTQKRLFILKNVSHRILDADLINQDILKIMQDFFNGHIIKSDI